MKNEINKIFSKIVKKLRKEIYDWSQQDLADYVKCEIKTIQRIEGALDNGNYKPSKDMILKIFKVFREHKGKKSIKYNPSLLRKMKNASDIFECFILSSKNDKDLIYDIEITNHENRVEVYSLLKLLFELQDLSHDDYLKLKGVEKFERLKEIDDGITRLNGLSIFLFGTNGNVPPDRDTKIKTYVYAYFTDDESDIIEVPNIPLEHYEQLTFTPLQYKFINNNYEITKIGWDPIYLSNPPEDLEKLFSAIIQIILGGEREVEFSRQMKGKSNVPLKLKCHGDAYSLIPPVNPEGYQCTLEELFFLALDIVKTISFLTNKRQGD